MALPLTKRQKQILDFIEQTSKRKGYAPSLEEIKENFKLKAISTVHEHLENLKHKGYIKKEMNQSRGLFVCKVDEFPLSQSVKVVYQINENKLSYIKHSRRSLIIDTTIVDKNILYFGIYVKDNSLEAFSYKSGSYIIVYKNIKPQVGDIVIKTKRGKADISEYNGKENYIGKIAYAISKID